jgi:hypothetical protein
MSGEVVVRCHDQPRRRLDGAATSCPRTRPALKSQPQGQSMTTSRDRYTSYPSGDEAQTSPKRDLGASERRTTDFGVLAAVLKCPQSHIT